MDQTDQQIFPAISMSEEEARQITNGFFRTRAVLSSKMRSRRLPAALRWDKRPDKRPSLRTPEIEVARQMSWQEVGEKLRAYYFAKSNERCDCYWCSRYQHTKRGRRENYWVNRVAFAILGDPSGLVAHLDSRRRLDGFDRMVLADLLNVAFRDEVDQAFHPSGRPRKTAARACASVAQGFYNTWKTIDRRSGVQDWGHSDEMKDQSCRVAIEMHSVRDFSVEPYHPMNIVPDFEEVRELMNRPATRRR
jgi:hypothetical protein